MHVACERQSDPIGNPREKVRLVNEQDRRGVVVNRAHSNREIVGSAAMARVGHRRQEVAKPDPPERPSTLGQSQRPPPQAPAERFGNCPADGWSVPEMPHAGENHCDIRFIGDGDHLGVAHRSSGLDDRRRAGFDRGDEAVGEWKERV